MRALQGNTLHNSSPIASYYFDGFLIFRKGARLKFKLCDMKRVRDIRIS